MSELIDIINWSKQSNNNTIHLYFKQSFDIKFFYNIWNLKLISDKYYFYCYAEPFNYDYFTYNQNKEVFTILQEIDNKKSLSLLNIRSSELFIKMVCEQILKDNPIYAEKII
jgi:hypothetical protein